LQQDLALIGLALQGLGWWAHRCVLHALLVWQGRDRTDAEFKHPALLFSQALRRRLALALFFGPFALQGEFALQQLEVLQAVQR
jgi:hypothetical protein